MRLKEVKTLASSVVGSTVSMIGGGRFSNGAATSAFSYALNQYSQAMRTAHAGSPIDDEERKFASEGNRKEF